MILGFAHVGCNVADVLVAEKQWVAAGYTRKWHYPDVINHPLKAPFGAGKCKTHSILLLEHPERLAVELTCHGKPNSISNRFEMGEGKRSIDLLTSNVETESNFFSDGLGFEPCSLLNLEFTSVVPAWSCQLNLIEGEYAEPTQLLGDGFGCIAFYTNDLKEDARRMVSAGGSSPSGSFEVLVGERYLTVSLLRSPTGIIIELINPGRYRGK
jgi:hypothetical protein